MPKVTVERRPITWQEMTRQAMAEEARKRPPMGWEVPSDQLYAPSSDVPITTGFAPSGAEYDPTPEIIASMVPWAAMTKLGMEALKKPIQNAPALIVDEVQSLAPAMAEVSPSISLQTPRRAKQLIEQSYVPGMFRTGGESIPAKELQLPNILAKSASAKNLKNNPNLKELMGTSIGQGESVREGKIADAIEAAVRAIRYERRLPKPKLPK